MMLTKTLTAPLPNLSEEGEYPSYYLVYRFEDDKNINLDDPSKIIAKVVNKSTSYFDFNELGKGKAYYYVVTSLDRLHNESKPVIIEIKN